MPTRRRIGVTTLYRWVAEELPRSLTAYVACGNRLFELVDITARSGRIAVRLKCLFGFTSTCTFVPRAETYYFSTPVYLSAEKDLAGKYAADIAQYTQPASFHNWPTADGSQEYAECAVYERTQEYTGSSAPEAVIPGHYCG